MHEGMQLAQDDAQEGFREHSKYDVWLRGPLTLPGRMLWAGLKMVEREISAAQYATLELGKSGLRTCTCGVVGFVVWHFAVAATPGRHLVGQVIWHRLGPAASRFDHRIRPSQDIVVSGVRRPWMGGDPHTTQHKDLMEAPRLKLAIMYREPGLCR